MANRYVRAVGGNWNAAGTWELTPGGSEVVLIPTSADDCYCVVGSGQLTINATAVCRSLNCTGYVNTITHNNFTLTIGDATAPAGGIALKLAGTYTVTTSGSAFNFASSGAGVHTVDYNNSLAIGNQTFSGAASYKLITNFTINESLAYSSIIHTAGTLDYNSVIQTGGNFQSTGSTARTLTLGNSSFIIWGRGATAFGATGSNLTVTANTADVYFLGLTSGGSDNTFAMGGFDWNGLSLFCGGAYATNVLTGGGTMHNLTVDATGFTAAGRGFYVTGGTTVTFTGDIYMGGPNPINYIYFISTVGGTPFTFSKASGTAYFYACTMKDIIFTGGATFVAYNSHKVSPISSSNVSGITVNNPVYYIDLNLGDDTSDSPYGWWKASFTNSAHKAPSIGDTVQGAISGATAKVSFVSLLEWNILGEGTIYFYGKSVTAFQSEQVNCAASGGHFNITSDFTYCAWKTISTTGATAARLAPGDTMRIAQSPIPTSLGVTGTWTTCPNSVPVAKSILSSTNTTPIVVNATAHGYSTGDCVYIQDHTSNPKVNGTWMITWISADSFSLDDSTATGLTGTGQGTITWATSSCVTLSAALTKTVCRCEELWTPVSGSTTSIYTTTYKEGDASAIVIHASPSNNTCYAYSTIPVTDFSSYQKLSFWVRPATSIVAGQWKLCLCSDDFGSTIVDTIEVPACAGQLQYAPLTAARTGDGNLGASIRSVALWSSAAAGPTTGFVIDNIIACTTNGLNLQSLISKNTAIQGTNATAGYGDEAWYAIQSISDNGKILRIDNYSNAFANAGLTARGGGYSTTGTSPETTTLYKRETIKSTIAVSSASYYCEIQESGETGALEYYEGGYDTATNLQTGETFIDGSNGWGYGFLQNGKTHISYNYISCFRFYHGISLFSNVSYTVLNNITNINCSGNYGIYLNNYSHHNTFNNIINLCNNALQGIYTYNNCTYNTITLFQNVSNNGNFGILFDTSCNNNNITTIGNSNNNAAGGVIFGTNSNTNHIDTITNVNYNYFYGYEMFNSNDNTLDNLVNANYNNNYGVYYSGANNNTIGTITNANYNKTNGIHYTTSSNNKINIVTNASYNTSSGIQMSTANNNTINTVTSIVNNGSNGLVFYRAFYNKIYSLYASGNGTSQVYNDWGINYIRNANLVGTEFTNALQYNNSFLFSDKHDQTTGNHYIYTDSGTITSDSTTNRHTASGICWKLSPTGTVRDITYPLLLSISKIACVANKAVTVKAWFKVTNITDIRGALVCREGQLSGYTTQIDTTANIDTNYEELSITFTPTEAGCVEIEAWAYWIAGTADESVYVDDMTITQVL